MQAHPCTRQRGSTKGCDKDGRSRPATKGDDEGSRADASFRENLSRAGGFRAGFALLFLLLPGVVVLEPQAGDWPQWHGPNRDRHAAADERLPSRLPTELQPLWKSSVGPGHASPVIAGNHLVYLDDDGTNEVAHCLAAATGRELWRNAFAERNVDEWGAGPRSTPFLEGDRVYVQSCRGEFRCLRLRDGQTLWGTSFSSDYGVQFLGPAPNDGGARHRGNNGSGIVDADAVIVPVGGTNDATVVAFDKRTGRKLWQAGRDGVAYASLVVTNLASTRQVIVFTADALTGFDRQAGAVLWRFPLRTVAHRHVATPVVFRDTIIVNSHTFGMVSLRAHRVDREWIVTEVWRNPALKINLATATLVDDSLYTQGADRDLICVDAATGKVRWSQPGFGRGGRDYVSIIAVGQRLLVLSEDGTLLLLAANPEHYQELGRLQVCGSTWSFPALADGKLYVRDPRQLLCLPLVTEPR